MRFRLLGAVQVHRGTELVGLGPRQQRLVLAVLAWEVNRLVPVDRLVELVWPESPPRTASHAIRVCVSQLRGLLATPDGTAPDEVTLLAQGPGYVLRTDPLLIDVHEFHLLLGQARQAGDDQGKVALLDQALGLWTGPALADTASEQTRARLCGGAQEARLIAMEDRFDALLRLGQHREMLGELTTLTGQHPTRERLIGQLVVALYRGGQASQALDVVRRTRAHLAEELGIDPGAELQRLELAVLRNDPALLPDPGPRLDRQAPVPVQLPPTIADFTGRADQLGLLDAAVGRTDSPNAVVISAIAGTAGVGKTALAVHWAHRVRDRYPDGQLYINLHGHATGPPLRPEQALAQFLRAVGVPAEQVPLDPAEATAMFRTVLADKRMLVVLDNAISAAQVRPLLPASPGCVVVITSRDRLDGLVAVNAARRISLDVLTTEEAVALLGRMLGEQRIAAEPEAAADLARTCACLPLALRIAAAQLANHPQRRIADQVAELRDGDLLSSLEVDGDEQSAVRAAFTLSYTALKPDAQRMFRLLGLIPGPDVDRPSAAALAGITPAAAARLLDRLAATHLIDQYREGRYTFHDLLRRYARETAYEQDPEAERGAALDRLTNYYLDSARAAVQLLYPYMTRLPANDEPADRSFDDHAGALAWLDAEKANLVAAVHHNHQYQRHQSAWLLADVLRGYLYFQSDFPEWIAVATTALAAAADQPQAEAAAHLSLGRAHHGRAQYPLATEHYTAALELCRESGWLVGEAGVLTTLGSLDENLGDLERAAERFNQALARYRSAGARHPEALALVNLGAVHERRGQLTTAAKRATHALEISRELGSRHGEADALYFLGVVAYQRGDLDVAFDLCTQTLVVYREIGARNDEAHALTQLANIHRAAGRLAEALDAAGAAVRLTVETGNQQVEASAREALAATLQAMGRHQEVSAEIQRTLVIAREVGARYEECQLLLDSSANQVSLGDPERAAAYAEHALALARDTGYRLLEAGALAAIAELRRAAGDLAEATAMAAEAAALHQACLS